ncbi:MAG: hypothetical protein ACM3O3_10790 [Syntrophothermus sp.]
MDIKVFRFFVITRQLKDNVKRSDKMLNKHDFQLWQMNIDEEIKKALFTNSRENELYAEEKRF